MPGREYGADTIEVIRKLVEKGIENMVVVVRHSARHYDLARPENEPFMSLTEEGKEYAFNMGTRLPRGYTLQLLSSVLGRCIETAYLLDKGYMSIGGKTRNAVIESKLAPFYVNRPLDLAPIFSDPGLDFIRYWFEGNVSPDIIIDSKEAARSKVDFLKTKLEQSKPGEIYLGVTHDWNLYLIKEHFLSLRHEDVGEARFLEGIVLYRQDDRLFLLNHQSDPVAVMPE